MNNTNKTRNGNARKVSTKATIFGVFDVAVIVRPATPDGACTSMTLRLPTLVKLLGRLGDAVEVRCVSQFSGMSDGHESVDRVVPLAGFVAWLKGRTSTSTGYSKETGYISYDPDNAHGAEITVSDACRHYEIVWRAERDRRANELATAPMRELLSSTVDVKAVTEDRATYLNRIADPQAWDEAVELFRTPDMCDPLRVLAVVDPSYLATLQARQAAAADAWTGLDDGGEAPAAAPSLADRILALATA